MIAEKVLTKELRAKANEFLNSRRNANNLVDIIAVLENNTKNNQPVTAVVLTLEVVFTELLKRGEVVIESTEVNENSPEVHYRHWLVERYNETLGLIRNNLEHEKNSEATQALVSSMKLLAAEGNHSPKNEHSQFPKEHLRKILHVLVTSKKSQIALMQRFKEYSHFVDVTFYAWSLLPQLISSTDFKNDVIACNYLELIGVLPVTKEVYEEGRTLCARTKSQNSLNFKYAVTRKSINRVWHNINEWSDGMSEVVHKQILIALLERFLPHLDKPILLTDFLMYSLDCGGPISLLALQGIFTLIQKHNIIYPNIYEKLYSMFEPEIFHTKFKARLYYLADIFLSSTHLPESLVAAFAKRLSRLSLIAPPQDITIILYFVGNLILRHAGLKRLICAKTPDEVSQDPYIAEEPDPVKSNALQSSLWEIVALQKHAIPSIATVARFISQPMPQIEWNLSKVLDVKEDDIFDEEVSKQSKQHSLAFERPSSMFLPKDDKVTKYWKLF